MSVRVRSCYRLSNETIAACVAMLKEEHTVRAIHEALGISGASVYDIRREHILGVERTHGRKLAEVSRRDLPTCACGLLLPCTCAEEDAARGRPRRAEDFMGRRDEPHFTSPRG